MPVNMSLHGLSAPYVQISLMKLLRYFDINDELKISLADILLNMMNHCQVFALNIEINCRLYDILTYL